VSWLSTSAVRCVFCCGHDGSGSVELGRAGRRSMMMHAADVLQVVAFGRDRGAGEA